LTGRNIYACVGIGEHQPAITLYRKLLAASSGSAELHVSLGNSLKAVGRQKEAAECYQMAAIARPSFGDAWWSLANLKTYRFSEDEIAHMRAEETAPAVDPVDHYHLCFALGKAFEDRNEYAESWRFYERGNALKRTESLYRPDISETNTRKQIEVCTAQFFAARASAGVPDPDPIFIVGLPRSGSTLIEQIPASHSQVEGTQELFIHLMMPNAKIIDARREPMACCFSNLKQLFTRGQEFTYSIEDIARYYRTYLELMRHWDAVLPGRILRVWYETSSRIWRETSGTSWNSAALNSNQPASSSTRRNVVSARQAQSRSGSPFSATGSSSGGNTSAGSARSRTVWVMD
jgi:tetratricopeptide (TPR) repeat protein